MTTDCRVSASERVTLYFYGELPERERRAFEQHLGSCEACAAAVADLELMRAALSHRAAAATRADVDWAGFMQRLDARIECPPEGSVLRPRLGWVALPPARVAWLALAATLMCATALGLLWQRRVLGPAPSIAADAAAGEAGLGPAAARHFDRAKLVVLGIAMKDPAATSAADWAHERELAASLLPETRLFRLSAADRGDARLASLLGDLETVLLQASMSADADAPELQRLQRVIRRRDLLVRMDLREL